MEASPTSWSATASCLVYNGWGARSVQSTTPITAVDKIVTLWTEARQFIEELVSHNETWLPCVPVVSITANSFFLSRIPLRPAPGVCLREVSTL